MKHTIFLALIEIIMFSGITWCAIFKDGAPALIDEEVENTPSLEMFNDESFTINTMSCVIPSVNFHDKSIDVLFDSEDQIKVCKHYNRRLLESNRTHIWINKNNYKQYKIDNELNFVCCYQSFHRPHLSRNQSLDMIDERVRYLECINFDNVIKVENEFVKVTCFYDDDDKPLYEQYFIFAPKKPFTIFRNDPFITPTNQLRYNVIIMGMSSMSRQNFYRTMVDTVEFLKSYNAIELKGYSTLAQDTFQNMMPVLMGMNDSQLRSTCCTDPPCTLDNCPFIWERFKDMGYYTALMETSRRNMFNRNTLGFRGNPTDYYVHPFIHQSQTLHGPDKQNKEKPVLRCMGDKYYFQVLVKYVHDITTTLKNFKFFGVFWESSMTHYNINDPEKMDYEYYRLLKNMEASGYLKNTIVIFMSDHGLDVGDIRLSKQGRMEQRLPLFFILLPPTFREKYSLAYDNLKLNEGRLTSPYDIHRTLVDLIDMTELTNKIIERRSTEFYSHDRGISLFLEIPRNRTCEMAAINKTSCACSNEVLLPSSSPILADALKFITNKVNEMLKPHPECRTLIVEEVIIAKEMIPFYESTTEWREIKLVVSMAPGGGIFETMLRYYKRKWTIIDNIKRLNCLGFQSLCVEDPVIKLLCTCKVS